MMLRVKMTDIPLRLSRISVLVALLMAVSCSDFIVSRNVKRMMGREIAFPAKFDGVIGSGRPKMVFHYRPSDCSTCRIRSLDGYNELFEKFENEVEFVILFSTTDIGYDRVRSEIENSSLKCKVYLDKGNEFDCINNFLPDDSRFHAFLLDNGNRIVFVGDPMSKESLLRLFEKKISGMR